MERSTSSQEIELPHGATVLLLLLLLVF